MTSVNAAPASTAPQRATVRRIYVLPTRFGGGFVLMSLLTLVGCINYLLSLGYALTFLLLGLWVVCAVAASRVLVGLRLHLALPERAFAGGRADLSATVHLPEGQTRTPVGVRVGGVLAWLPPEQTGAVSVTLHLPTPRRGLMPLPTVRVEGHDPLGLWHSTTYPGEATLPAALLVYPAPELNAPPPPLAPRQTGSPAVQRRSGDEEVSGLREYRPGDAPSRMAWKQTARLDVPLTRLYDAPVASLLTLDWDETRMLPELEARVSRLTAWVLEVERRGADFVLRLPGAELDGSAGMTSVRQALDLLAVYGLPEAPAFLSRRTWPRRPGPFRRPPGN
ncbi:DUF58 domain-containing protein [Deinococcus sp.]|uniref:DUF58 domain-containing protein n=1 Tax=Deinococcus sp. TaxID=47478 RepID=UPI003CC5F984